MGGGQDTGHRSAVWYWSAERRTINNAIDILGAQGRMLEMCCVCVLSVDIRGAGHRTSDSWDWTSLTFWIHRTLGELKILCLILHISELEKSVQFWYLFAWKWDIFVLMSPRPRLSVLVWIFVSRVQGVRLTVDVNTMETGDSIGDWRWGPELGSVPQPLSRRPHTDTGHHWSPWHRRLCNNFHHLYIQSWWDPAQSKIL